MNEEIEGARQLSLAINQLYERREAGGEAEQQTEHSGICTLTLKVLLLLFIIPLLIVVDTLMTIGLFLMVGIVCGAGSLCYYNWRSLLNQVQSREMGCCSGVLYGVLMALPNIVYAAVME